MSTYLITGGAGFIGSNLARAIVNRGESVRILDNFATGTPENLDGIVDDVEVVKGSVEDAALCARVVEGVDYVLHEAALPSVPRSVSDPVASNSANVDGTLNMLVAARDAGVKRFVYAASSSAYGDTPTLPKVETMPANPLSPYAITKYTGELYCQTFYRLYGLETIALRYFNIFGPRQDPTSQYSAVIPKFITMLMAGDSPTIYGDGAQSRDFTYIDNVVHANLLACEAPAAAAGEVVNCACGDRITLNELAAALQEMLGTSVEVHHDEPRPGDVKHSLADITKASELLGYTPQVSIREGLEKTVAWYREQ